MWVKLDDQFYAHPKIVRVGPLGMALQVAGLCYCNQFETDGFIPLAKARTLLSWEFQKAEKDRFVSYSIDIGSGMHGETVTSDFVIELLLHEGIWEEQPDGYLIHDYARYQKSKVEIEELRTKRATVGRMGGLAKGRAIKQMIATPEALPADDEKRIVFPDDFLSFWSVYPNKAGKRGALNAWKKAKKNGLPSIEKIIQAVELQKQSDKWKQGFVLNPTTWLNQGHWDDEITHTTVHNSSLTANEAYQERSRAILRQAREEKTE